MLGGPFVLKQNETMKPDEGARQNIDEQLTQSRWIIPKYKSKNLYTGLGIAVCEQPTNSGKVDHITLILFFSLFKIHSNNRNHIIKII